MPTHRERVLRHIRNLMNANVAFSIKVEDSTDDLQLGPLIADLGYVDPSCKHVVTLPGGGSYCAD